MRVRVHLIGFAQGPATAREQAETLLDTVEIGTTGRVALATRSRAEAQARTGLPYSLAATLDARGASVQIVAPARVPIAGLIGDRDQARWTAVSLQVPGGRLASVTIPAALATATTRLLVAPIPPTPAESPVLGLWPAFAGGRYRIAAALSGARDGIAAEIVAAFLPAWMVLSGAIGTIDLLIATTDPVAAELVALAVVHASLAEHDPERSIGPWETPLVQRATELEIGVRLPSEIELVPRWAGHGPPPAAFRTGAEAIAALLGIAPSSIAWTHHPER